MQQLVIQVPAVDASDFDAGVEIEERLSDDLTDGSEVDGHDFGPRASRRVQVEA